MSNLEIGRCPQCARNLVVRNENDQIISFLPEYRNIWVVYENVDRAEDETKRDHKMSVVVCKQCIDSGVLTAESMADNMIQRGEEAAIYNSTDGLTPVSIEVRK